MMAVVGWCAGGTVYGQLNWTNQILTRSPAARSGQSMVYDAARQKVVLFGGYTDVTNSNLGDTWEWDGTNWTEMLPTNSPSPREGATMAYDALHQQVILYGGVFVQSDASTVPLGETWVWDGVNWTRKSPANSPALGLGAGTMAYDGARQQVVMLQFSDSGMSFTWVWDGTNWTQKTPTTIVPGNLYGSSMAFDAARQQIVLFGEYEADLLPNNNVIGTWVWDGTNWTEMALTVNPGPREDFTLVYDPRQQKTVLFGGDYFNPTTSEFEFLSDTWAWDGANWTQEATVSAPPGRAAYSMAYDAALNTLVLSGGWSATETSVTDYNGTWVLAQPQVTTGLRFVPVVPCRVADTRNADGEFGGPILAAGTAREFVITASSCGIPSSAQAYALNLTAVPVEGLSYMTIWPSGQTLPPVSTLNSDGRVKAVSAMPAAGPDGGINVFATDDTHVVIDINGYFVAATDASALAFYPMTPCRVMDTRLAGEGPGLTAGQTRTVSVAGSACNVPAGAEAYSLNFTVLPRAGLGYLATWPSGQSQPLVSTLNATHAVTSNAAVVPAGANGAINVYASDATDVILDINGYFGSVSSGALSFYAQTPCRVLDTRASSIIPGAVIGKAGPIGTGACSVPTGVQALVLNATVVPNAGLGYLSLWPDGQTRPVVSTLNSDGSVNSNLAIVPLQAGAFDLFASDWTQVIFDLNGYFAP